MHSALKPKLNCGVSLGAVAASLLLMSVPAGAADQTMETVVVTGIRASLESALVVKRDAAQVMDAISAEDIGKFPDKDMGEALQRVTGVQITRSSGGEGSTVTIRGGDPGMTRVEINGTGALSVTPAATDRAIDFRDLPVEFVSRLEVIKSPTADMTEGGLGGTVRVITRRPFDSQEAYLAGSAQVINGNLPGTTDPKFALIGSKLFFGDTLGVLVSGTYEQNHEADDQALTTGWATVGNSAGNARGSDIDNDGTKDFAPYLPRYFMNRRNTMRYAVNAVVEYRPSDDLKVFWDTTFARGYENVRNNAFQLSAYTGVIDYANTTLFDDGSSYGHTVNHLEVSGNGVTGSLPLDLTFRTINGYLTRQQLTTALGFSYNVTDELKVEGRFDYARARVDNQELDVVADQFNTPSAIIDMTGSERAPNIQLPGTNMMTASGVQSAYVYYTPYQDTTHSNTATLDVTYNPHWAEWLTLKAGYRRHDQIVSQWFGGHRVGVSCRNGTDTSSGNLIWVHVANCSTLQSVVSAGVTDNGAKFFSTGKLGFTDEIRSWAFLGPKLGDDIAALAAANGTLVGSDVYNPYNLTAYNPNPNVDNSFQTKTSTWGVGEGTTDFYGMASIDFPEFYLPVSGNFGIRVVETNTQSTGYSADTIKFKSGSATIPDLANTVCPQTTANVTANASTAGGSCIVFSTAQIKGGYTETLPSANLKVDIIPDQLIARFGWGKVMSLPNPADMSLSRKTDVIGLTGSQGNPGLLPYMSSDYNLSFEWYFSKLDAVTVGLFQKNISRFISSTSSTVTINDVDYLMSTKINGTDKVRIEGIEVGLQYVFDWLPKPFDGFGVTANMTIQKDSGYTQKNLIDGSALTFPGLSKQSENASIFYENEDISVRLSYVWRSKWMIKYQDRGNLPLFNASYGELDASASYNLTDYLSVFMDAVNLTDSQLVQYNTPYATSQFDTFGRRLYFGVRAKY